jgi:Rps23 Pro-64 3,4-dihydroxylase Tpa1-like proline 4-hydroxylase
VHRKEIADLILEKLKGYREAAASQFADRRCFIVDGLLPEQLVHAVYGSFPDPATMMLRDTLRERKFVTSQMNACKPLIEETVYAFQDPRVVEEVASITGLKRVEPDDKLYAGGISMMGPGHYLHPHLDNSHDLERRRYRILNLLFYTSPDWREEFGGNLELWPDGARSAPFTIPSVFNRLLVIATDRSSWHSVSRIRVERNRTCVSNYYFSPVSPEREDYFHVTSFRGRPEQPIRDILLRADALMRATIRKVFPKGLKRTRHLYEKKSD